MKTDLLEELQEQVLVKEGGKGKAVSKQRAMIKSLMARAVQGDVRAVSLLFTMLLKLVPDDADDDEIVDFTEADLAILKQFKQSALKSAKTKEKSSDK